MAFAHGRGEQSRGDGSILAVRFRRWPCQEGLSDEELEAIARGQGEAAAAIGTAVIGGNLGRRLRARRSRPR